MKMYYNYDHLSSLYRAIGCWHLSVDESNKCIGSHERPGYTGRRLMRGGWTVVYQSPIVEGPLGTSEQVSSDNDVERRVPDRSGESPDPTTGGARRSVRLDYLPAGARRTERSEGCSFHLR